MRIILWVVPLIIFAGSISNEAKAQEQFGLRMSNYGGILSAQLNPATSANSRLFFDFNLLSGYASVENNFLYIHRQDYNLLNFISKNPILPSYDVRGQGLDYAVSQEPVQTYQLTGFTGPSFSLSLGRHAVGFISGARVATSIRDLPRDIAILMFEGLEYDSLFGIDQVHQKFSVASLGWYELGINYAYLLKSEAWYNLAGGINLRYLRGYAGAQLSNRIVDYTLEDANILNIRNLDADIGFSAPVDYETNEFPGPGNTFRGSGFGIDIGISYRKNREPDVLKNPRRYCQYPYHPYIYKLGLSLIDLGGIGFREQVQAHNYNNVEAYWNEVDTLEFYNINAVTSELSRVFYGDPNASANGNNRFRVGLPAALSFQADVNYYPKWYLSGAVVLPLTLSQAQLNRPGQAMLSLRYETTRFEVNLPVSLYDFQKPRIGLYARYLYFSLGTDKLGGLFGFSDFYGLDIYFSAKFHLIKGRCNRYKPQPDCRHLAF